ncbi:hypothetical protein BGX34_004393 [Mortierella sp. NVP85]|nr:hypothetical protein BGX34_004393 [Mortierella sp. NVP85]
MSVIQLITASSPSLRLVDLAECRLITNLTVQVIAQLCSQLEELSLQGCGLVTDDAIEELAHHCTRLTNINLGRCFRVSDRSLLALLRNSGRMTPTGFTYIRERTRNARLTRLGIAGCHGVTLAGLLAIERYLSLTLDSENGDEDAIELDDLDFEHDSSLISLEFTCPALKKSGNKAQNGQLFPTTAITAAHTNISQASRFFNTLPRTLEEITIHDAHTLSHDDVVCLVDRVGPSLKTLRFDNANAVSTDTLTHILTMCPHLTVLCIPRATRLDDSGVAQLKAAKCAQSLVELDLSACHTLTDACLTSLATGDSSEPSTGGASLSPRRNSNGKSVCGREQAHRFPNLRRLDLSYNDKMTLAGIIPLVMSLKSLCALDVSFCGEGVTRSWNSSLDPLRSILNPSAVDSPQSPSEQGNNFNRNNNNSHTGGANTSNDGYGGGSSSLQSSASSRQLQEQTHQAPMTTASTATYHPTSLQSVQQITSGVNNMTISGRRGLGGYVGPRLNRPIITQNNDPTLRQYPGQRGSVQEHQLQQDQSSSSSPTTPRFKEFPTNGQHQDQCSHGHYCNCNSSTSSFSPRIILADRLDILEYTPRRVGIPARFHLESWFTPQHQSQLQQLFQIQLQRQRDLQDQQAGAAAALLTAAAAIAGGGGYGFGHGIGQGNVLGFSLGNHGADVASLSPEMMAHPVMVAARAGVATLPLNGGQGLGLPGEQRAQNQHLPWQHRQQQQQQPVNVDTMEMNDNLNRNLRLEHRQQLGGRFVPGMARRHHHRQYHHRRGSLNYGGGVMGHCEISAWGLSKLREEWAMS